MCACVYVRMCVCVCLCVCVYVCICVYVYVLCAYNATCRCINTAPWNNRRKTRSYFVHFGGCGRWGDLHGHCSRPVTPARAPPLIEVSLWLPRYSDCFSGLAVYVTTTIFPVSHVEEKQAQLIGRFCTRAFSGQDKRAHVSTCSCVHLNTHTHTPLTREQEEVGAAVSTSFSFTPIGGFGIGGLVAKRRGFPCTVHKK